MSFLNTKAYLLLLAIILAPKSVTATQFHGSQVPIEDVVERGIQDQAKHVVILYEKEIGFPKGAFCSGFLASYKGELFLFTASHCIDKKKKHSCGQTAVVSNYTEANLDLISKTIFPDDSVFSKMAKLSLKDSSVSEPKLLQTNAFRTLDCKEEIVRKDKTGFKDTDIVVLRLNEPPDENTPAYRLEDIARPVDFLKDEESFILGHPQGLPMKASIDCKVKSPYLFGILMDEFIGISNCRVEKGNSGGPIFLTSSYQPIGVVQSHLENSSEPYPTKFTYVSSIAEGLIRYLNGDQFAGFLSLNSKIWLDWKENITIELRDEGSLDSQKLNKFKSIIPSIISTIRANSLPKGRFLTIYVRSKPYEGRQSRFPVIFFDDSNQVVADKIIKLIENP